MVIDPVALEDDNCRRRINEDLDTTLVVVAGAGTGKTTALVGRILQLVRTGAASMGDIAAITFTEAAAAELRERLRDALALATSQAPGDRVIAKASAEVDEAAICTLHTFAQRLLVEQSVAAELPPGFEVLDGTAEVADFKARWARFADALLDDPDAQPALIRGFTIGLLPRGLEDVAHSLHTHWDRLEDAPLEDLFGSITSVDVAAPIELAPIIDALERALALAPWCTSEDDLMLRHLRDVVADALLRLAAVGDEETALSELAQLPTLRCTYGQKGHWGDRVDEVRAACQEAQDARNAVLETVRRSVLADVLPRLAAFVLGAADERRVEGRITFHDLLVLARRVLRQGGEATEALRRRYRRLLVDEFQDTDPIQVELAARLTAAVDGPEGGTGQGGAGQGGAGQGGAGQGGAGQGGAGQGGAGQGGAGQGGAGQGGGGASGAGLGSTRPGGLFLVGDPKQSIYRFRRADIEMFDRVGKEVGDQVVLRTNFRSVPGILDFVNVVFAELFSDPGGPGQAVHHDLVPSRLGLPAGVPNPTSPGATSSAVANTSVQLTLAGFDTDGADGAGGSGGSNETGATRRPGARRAVRPEQGPIPVVVMGGHLGTTVPDVRRQAARDAADAMRRIVEERWPVAGRDGDLRPTRWSDIAVLIPARSALAALEEAFDDVAVPYRLEGAAMLWASQEVRDVVAVLRAVDDPADGVAVLAALRSPGLACGDDDLVTWYDQGGRWDPRAPIAEHLADHPVAGAMTVLDALHRERWWSEPSVMVSRALADLHSFELAVGHRRPRDHWNRLRWLSDQSRLFDDTVGGPLRSFLHWADIQAENEMYSGGVGPPDPDDDAVRVMTIHGAKGLEFPVVVVAGLERDDAAASRTDAVLWNEEGLPEVSAGRSFETTGYEEAKKRDRLFDALERQRLLYVAMTRARDHLLLCLHYKGRQDGPDSSAAAVLDTICARNVGLWRRLPVEPSSVRLDTVRRKRGATSTRRRAAQPIVSSIRTPWAQTPGSPETDSGADPEAGLEPEPEVFESAQEWQTRLDEWQGERTGLLARLRRQPVVTATAVAHQPAMSAEDPGWPAPEGGGWRRADVALQIGRAVHAAMATLDLATGRDASGHSAAELAATRALAHGVAAHQETVVAMVDLALSSSSVRNAAAGRYWREMYVGAPVDGGGVIEGYVDLLYEDGEDLVVVDYKTDRVGGPVGLNAAAQRYRLQVATYALAVQSSTGRPVRRCVLVFVGDAEVLEYVLEGPELDSARQEALVVAAALIAP